MVSSCQFGLSNENGTHPTAHIGLLPDISRILCIYIYNILSNTFIYVLRYIYIYIYIYIHIYIYICICSM